MPSVQIPEQPLAGCCAALWSTGRLARMSAVSPVSDIDACEGLRESSGVAGEDEFPTWHADLSGHFDDSFRSELKAEFSET